MKIWCSSNFSSAFLQKQTVVLWTEISRYLYSECETLPREWVKALLATLSGNVTPAGSGPVSAVSMAMPGGISVCLQKASLCFRPAASCRGWNPSWSQYRGERSGSHRSPILNITRVQIRLRFIKTERKKLWHQHTLINIRDRQYIFRQIKYCFGIGTRIKTTWNQTAWINEMSSLKSPNSDTRVTSSP